MAELAFLALLTIPLLVEHAHHRLRVHAKRHLLHLHRLEQFRRLSSRLFGCQFFLLALRLFGVFALLLGRFGGGGGGLDLGDGFFGGRALFVLHAEGFVLDDFGRGGLFGGVVFLGRHDGG